MEYSFINLDSCVERKRFVESNFSSAANKQKNITRIDAVDTAYIATHKVAGILRDNEKACYLSHCKAIEASITHNDHVFIAEDDVLFCERSTQVTETVINSIKSSAWDVIYTDICFPHLDIMLDLFVRRRVFDQDSKIHLINLVNKRFTGATAYIINKASKQKVLDLLRTNSIDTPIDLALRQLFHAKKIKGHALFPFTTSLSMYAENSQIQAEDDLVPDFLFNAFRRLVWLGRDIDTALATVDKIDPSIYQPDSDAFCVLLRGLFSEKIKLK